MTDEIDTLWERLEGRADLFEATRLRYRALLGIVRGLFWKSRLLRDLELLREVAQTQAEVDVAVRATWKRAEAERWPESRGPLRLVIHIERLGDQLLAATRRRLGKAVHPRAESLAPALLLLEAEVLGAPRTFISPGSVGAAALSLLPRNLPALQVLLAQVRRLEPMARRPDPTNGAFPLGPGEAREFAEVLEVARKALVQLRARVATLEPTGTVLEHLDRKARLVHAGPGRTGASQYLYGASLVTLAEARAFRWMAAAVWPLTPEPREVVAFLRWIDLSRSAPAEALVLGDPARAGLLETCVRLSRRLSGRVLLPFSDAALRSALARAEQSANDQQFPVIAALTRAVSAGGVPAHQRTLGELVLSSVIAAEASADTPRAS